MRVGLASLMFVAGLLAGCAPSSFSDRPATLHYVDPSLEKATPAETERRAIQAYHSPNDAERMGLDRRSYRDSVIWRMIAADDDDFNGFVRRVRSDRSLMTLSADGGVIFLNGLATVTGTAGEKAALAALSSGLLGIKGSFDRELFNQEAMSAILARMKAARIEALAEIEIGLDKDIARYPLERALRDVRTYADAGSLLATIDAITTDAGRATTNAEAKVAEVTRSTTYRDSRDAVEALDGRITALTDAQALGMMFAMNRRIATRSEDLQGDLKAQDPANARFKSGVQAKSFLKYWLQQESGAAPELEEWRDALDLAEKG